MSETVSTENDVPDAEDGLAFAVEADPGYFAESGSIELHCDDCQQPYGVWFADNEVWNYVIGGPGAKGDPGGMLCPRCFTMRAEATFRQAAIWHLVLDNATRVFPSGTGRPGDEPDATEEAGRVGSEARYGRFCTCGHMLDAYDLAGSHPSHQADALLASPRFASLIAEAKAEALREAADALPKEERDDPRWTASLLGYYGEANWLRDRAAALAATRDTDQAEEATDGGE